MYIVKRIKQAFSSLLSASIIYKFVFLIKSTYLYLKDYNNVGEFLYGDTFKKLIKQYLNLDLDRDWLGRLYGIINPNLDIEGNLNVNNIVIELDGRNTNNNEYVKIWIYKQLNMIGDLFKMHNVYNYIDMDIERVGPVNGDNFLVVFDIVSRQEMAHYFKLFMRQLLFYAIIAVVVWQFVL